MVANAVAAILFAPKAEPALKLNYPNHNKPVPNITYVIRAGLCTWLFLDFKYIAEASAAQPALICTTVPPAKSSTPNLAKMPSGHVACAIGQ